MDNITLNQILENICIEEAAAISDVPVPKLSYRHRRHMKKIFSQYQKSVQIGRRPCVAIGKRLVIVMTIIILAMYTAAAGAMAINGFNQKRYHDYTTLLTVNADNCPKTIENVYYLPEISKGYELDNEIIDDYFVYRAYLNKDTGGHITFVQDVKNGYKSNFNTEYNEFETLTINGHYALYLETGNSEEISGLLVWDNGDYVLEISGNLSKDELIELAKTAKF